MYIIAHDSHGQVVKMEVVSVVVYDEYSQPISLAVRIMDRTAIVSHKVDKDFDSTLKTLGIDKADHTTLSFVDGSKI